LGDDAKRRLQCMAENNNGFRIAEEDLALRGPGEFFGVRQAGMPDMVVADIIRDGELLEAARAEAFELARRDPELGEHPLLRDAVERFWKGKAECFRTG
jgi:ATP-dependent DNA helicase RecG